MKHSIFLKSIVIFSATISLIKPVYSQDNANVVDASNSGLDAEMKNEIRQLIKSELEVVIKQITESGGIYKGSNDLNNINQASNFNSQTPMMGNSGISPNFLSTTETADSITLPDGRFIASKWSCPEYGDPASSNISEADAALCKQGIAFLDALNTFDADDAAGRATFLETGNLGLAHMVNPGASM